ncbi:STAS domain-containing protein [Amycolatopsis sp. cmx-4-83]|uniref:STAS domain-containing protein n=1 Tax=Amycolatopsis sp. cmx-4-83 TaxID=2790940 RepID=UPI00397DEA8B
MTDLNTAEPDWSVTIDRATTSDGIDQVQVVVIGAIDPSTTPKLRAAWTAALQPPAPHCVRFDLTRVMFCGSHGMRSLVEAADACEAGGVTMRVLASPPVRRVAEITHLSEVLHLEP